MDGVRARKSETLRVAQQSDWHRNLLARYDSEFVMGQDDYNKMIFDISITPLIGVDRANEYLSSERKDEKRLTKKDIDSI